MSATARHAAGRRRRGTGALRLDLTSMIDVTFLLLVYFMTATSFRTGEEIYRMDIPERGGAAMEADPFAMDDEPLRVHVASNASGAEGGYRLRLEGPWPQPRSFEELTAFLREHLLVPGRASGLFGSDHPVIVQPAASAHWQHVMSVFNAAASSGYENVTLAGPQ